MRFNFLPLLSVCIGIGCILSSPCHRRQKRCTMPECDLTGALSMCAEANPHCPAHHDDVFDRENICRSRGLRCCRSICSGRGSMCLPRENPCLDGYESVPGTCPYAVNDRYQCCRPIKLRSRTKAVDANQTDQHITEQNDEEVKG